MHADRFTDSNAQFEIRGALEFSTALVAPATTLNNHLQHESYLQPYRRAAINCLLDHDLELPPWDSLSLIVESAVAARDLFFTAATHRPSAIELQQVFEAFVLFCVNVPIGEVIQ